MKIIQLVNGYSKGDGVGNVIVAFDALLKKMGYCSEIHNKTLSFSDLNNADYSGENMILYHVALTVDPLICYLKCRKVLIFHNITDPQLLLGSGLAQMRTLCSAGLYDIQDTANNFERAIVFSKYSQDILVKSGWEESKISIIPISVRLDKMTFEKDDSIYERYSDGKVNILFTGRVFPNKKQDSLIRSFKQYHDKYNENSRLLIVGNHSNSAYYDALKRLVYKLKVENDVVFTGRVSLTEYVTYYQIADVFLCMSEHEGFCIPLVEAMHYNVPIIALNRTAIPDTLSGCGVLLDCKNYETFADEINRIIQDGVRRNDILEGQNKRLKDLSPGVLETRYRKLLEMIIDFSTIPQYKSFDDNTVIGDQISVPDQIKNEQNVIYGYGAAGNRLHDKLTEIGIENIAVCDANKGGSIDGGIKIETIENALSTYRNANFIISIQDKGVIKNVVCLILDNGIQQKKIFVYDEENERVI